MTQQHHQNHATWECKYHVVFIPKDRKKAIFGSTVGRDEEMIRAYIKNQEMQDRELDQLSMIP